MAKCPKSMRTVNRAAQMIESATGSRHGAMALAEELRDAGLLTADPKSGMLKNGDTFGDEDEGPEGGHSVFDLSLTPKKSIMRLKGCRCYDDMCRLSQLASDEYCFYDRQRGSARAGEAQQ